MPIKIFDSLRGEVVDFVPLNKGEVTFYVCGPTVYDLPHLGHGRSAVVFDVIRKYFLFRGFNVQFVSNYTDIDDKMIARAEAEYLSVDELAARIIPEYQADYEKLGIMKPDIQPKATEYIDQIVDFIGKLEQKGMIYVIKNDGVYFDIKRFKAYGCLSKQKLEDLMMGARVKLKEAKRNPNDFALWKFQKEGEPFWCSPWGDGRPGWHIECSAMSWANLGESFDIHGGGLDLKFPHHECEIAQSKGVFGDNSFAKYWVHNGFITINKEKMSKSLGNFFTLREIFKKYSPQVVRFFFLQTHYRSPIDFSDHLLEQAASGLRRIHDFIRNLKAYKPDTKKEINLVEWNEDDSFFSGMDNDFNLSETLSLLFDLIKMVNKMMDEGELNDFSKTTLLSFLEKIDSVLGIIFPMEEIELSGEQKNLLRERELARAEKNWSRSDEIRDELFMDGIVLEDTKEGTIWKKV